MGEYDAWVRPSLGAAAFCRRLCRLNDAADLCRVALSCSYVQFSGIGRSNPMKEMRFEMPDRTDESLVALALTFSRHRNLLPLLAMVIAATPCWRRIAMFCAADPELVCNNSRSLRDRPDQHDSEKRVLARVLAIGRCHRMQLSRSDGGASRRAVTQLIMGYSSRFTTS
jgi:hypothetical protein